MSEPEIPGQVHAAQCGPWAESGAHLLSHQLSRILSPPETKWTGSTKAYWGASQLEGSSLGELRHEAGQSHGSWVSEYFRVTNKITS